MENTITFFQDCLVDKKFSNNVKAFTVTFDQFNASLLNKSINLIHKITPNFLNVMHNMEYDSFSKYINGAVKVLLSNFELLQKYKK